MRLLTNPASNMPASALSRYDILLARQTIVVDQQSHDTRADIPLATIDRWVATAKEFPKVLGSTSADLVPVFLDAVEKDRDLLVVVTSRRLIPTYHSAVSAAATVKTRVARKDTTIHVVDTLSTDLGAALVAIAAAEVARTGLSAKDTAALVDELAARGRTAMHVQNMSHTLKSGRASLLKAWMTSILQVRPIMGIADGDLRVLGRIREKDDPVVALADHFSERMPERPRVWLGIAHGGDPSLAARCKQEMEGRFDVAFSLVRPLSSSLYLYLGPGALAVFVLPIEGLSRPIPTPAPLLDV